MTFSVHPRADLAPLTTFGVPATAARLLTLEHLSQLPDMLADPEFQAGPRLILGGGSNLLFTRDYPGTVLRVALRGIRVLADDGEHMLVEAAAGENWHAFVRQTLELGAFGLENLSLIPGTVGAAPVQNIGAYGVEAGDLIDSVVCVDLASGEQHVVSGTECAFGYRDSRFKHEWLDRRLITAVRFRLSRRFTPHTGYGAITTELASHGIDTPGAQDVSDAICRIRSARLPDPRQLGNAGSFFKNPVLSAEAARQVLAGHPEAVHYPTGDGRIKFAAGWLIESAGLKGYRQGAAGVHDRQALVLVNHGGAHGQDIRALAHHVQDTIRLRYGIDLEPEPLIL